MQKVLLRGTISVRVEAGSPAKAELDITPAEGFLTPKSIANQQAIAFPENTSEPEDQAKLIPLIHDSIVQCIVDDSIKDLLAPLLNCAVQNRPVTLHLDVSVKPPKVVGFQCP